MEAKALYTELSNCWESAFPTLTANPQPPNQLGILQAQHLAQQALDKNRQKVVEYLLQNYSTEDLARAAGDLYFNPRSWQFHDQLMPHMMYWFQYKLNWVSNILEMVLVRFQPDDIHIQIEQFLANYVETINVYYMYPKAHDTPTILTLFKPSPALIALAKRILGGEFQLNLSTTAKPMFSPQFAYYHHETAAPLANLVNYLSQQGELDYSSFRQFAINFPQILSNLAPLILRSQAIKTNTNLIEAVERYHQQLVDEITSHITNENYRVLLTTRRPISGIQYVMYAAEAHNRLKLDKITGPNNFHWSDSVEHAVTRLATVSIQEPANPAEEQMWIEQFRTFPSKTLQRLLPVAEYSRHLICKALNWDDAIPFVDLIVEMAGIKIGAGGSLRVIAGDIPNGPDTHSGVVAVNVIESVIGQAGENRAKTIIKLFRESKVGVSNTLTLLEAVMGWNRNKVEDGLLKHNQITIKAYGALPLERGDIEVLERYRILKKSAKDGQKFGQMRRANQAAAAQVGLLNLVQRTGYSDLARFEWAMESKIAEEVSAPNRKWMMGDYQIQLEIEGTEAALVVSRQGKTLKSPPKEVRSHVDYAEAKEALAQYRSQTRRLRTQLLEASLENGSSFAADEFDYLLKFPAARSMLERLLLRTADGRLGLCLPDQHAIRDLSGAIHQLDQPFQVAHPYHLYQEGELAAWQKLLVHERIIQPFKQGFRELYLLTPAEQNTGTYSNRFAGHSVISTQAAKLLISRGWKTEQSEYPVPYKVFGDKRVVWDFLDIQHFFGGGQPARSDSLHFEPYPAVYKARMQRGDNWLKLDEIDPLIFSEVMRDADLVVSVAQRDGEAGLSSERYEQRGNLVMTLLDDLGLPGVRVDGHYAYIDGKLAKYRVHLGSAVIHIEPGNYLCIVPDRWGKKHESVFLPFADEGDSKISEVISKILLLLADDKIKDETILRQIRR
jgi:hypothetical protein